MQNWTIGKRIATGFAAVLIIMLALGIYVRMHVQTIKTEMADVSEVSIPTLKLLADAKCLTIETRLLTYKHIGSQSAADRQELEAKISAGSARITKDLNEYEKLIDSQDMHLLDQVKTARENYRVLREQILAASGNATNGEATAQVYGRARAEMDPLAATYAEALGRCEEQETKEGDADAAQVTAAIHGTNLGLLAGMTAALIIASLFSFLIGRSTKRVLQTVSNSLNDAANHVSTAAGQVSSASQTLACGASEQASSLEEASASLEEMTSMTKRNCANTGNANALAKQARAVADKGVNDMQTMSVAMAAIKVSSDDIAKIIKTIDEIAFQTNILALNAAVEAARAGEAGMGFAVVADEVRNLAQRCAQAARETSGKIEDAIAKTGQGVAISEKVSAALNEIVTKVRQVDDLVSEVAGASKEQADGITQINAAVGQMDTVTQGNAATAEESAAAAEELNAQARSMKESVMELMTLVGNDALAGDRYPGRRPTKATGFIARITAPASMVKSGGDRRREIPLEDGFKDF